MWRRQIISKGGRTITILSTLSNLPIYEAWGLLVEVRQKRVVSCAMSFSLAMAKVFAFGGRNGVMRCPSMSPFRSFYALVVRKEARIPNFKLLTCKVRLFTAFNDCEVENANFLKLNGNNGMKEDDTPRRIERSMGWVCGVHQ